MANVAFLGLGVMGYPMAGWLARKGHKVTVYNRTRAKAEKWREQHGGGIAKTPAEAVRDVEIAFSCVGDDPDLRAIALGPDGVVAGLPRGAIYVDHTTASAGVARELRNRMFQSGTESAGFAGLKWMYEGLDLARLFE